MSGGADGSSLLLSDLAGGRHDVAPKSAPVGVQWELRGAVGAQWELQIYNYAHFRPHEALGGATPAEIYFGRTPSHLSAIPPPAAGRAKSQWFCRFASSTSTRSGFCRYWLEKLPEGRSPGENVGRRVRARRHRSDRGSGLRAPTPAAIPIAPLQLRAIPIAALQNHLSPAITGGGATPEPRTRVFDKFLRDVRQHPENRSPFDPLRPRIESHCPPRAVG
jgi:hypothetical protein